MLTIRFLASEQICFKLASRWICVFIHTGGYRLLRNMLRNGHCKIKYSLEELLVPG